MTTPEPVWRRLTGLLGVEYPVLQAGMGTAAGPALVAAACEGGGLGILGCLRRNAADVETLIAEVRGLTSRPFGANHVIAHLDLQALEATLEAQAPVISSAWGDPTELAQAAHAAGSLVVHQVNTVEEALRAQEAGVDVIVAQGGEGGGHVGRRSTFTLVPEVVDAVAPTLVVAAGGITDHRGVAGALMLGAAGVLIGTRFIATYEASVADHWKQIIVTATGDQTVTTGFYDAMRSERWPGATVRTVRNPWTDEWEDRPDEWEAVAEELRASFLKGFATGEFPMGGEGVGLIHELLPATEVPRRLWQGALDLLSGSGPA